MQALFKKPHYKNQWYKIAGFPRINYTKDANGELPTELPGFAKFGFRKQDSFNLGLKRNSVGYGIFIVKTQNEEIKILPKFFFS